MEATIEVTGLRKRFGHVRALNGMTFSTAGVTGTDTAPNVLGINGISSERLVVLLSENGIPFTEVSAHRASLEEACMDLTRDAVEFRAAP